MKQTSPEPLSVFGTLYLGFTRGLLGTTWLSTFVEEFDEIICDEIYTGVLCLFTLPRSVRSLLLGLRVSLGNSVCPSGDFCCLLDDQVSL